MKKVIYRKTFTYLLIALVISSVMSKLVFKTHLYFNFLLAFFSVFYILIGWIFYLRLDGISIFSSSRLLNNLSKDDVNYQRYWFKGKVIDDMEDEFVHLDLTPNEYDKLTMTSFFISGVITMIISFIS